MKVHHKLVPLLVVAAMVGGCMGPGELPGPATQPEALSVPSMPLPTLDRIIGIEEWSKALSLKGSFHIADGGKADGTYPFELKVGQNDKRFFLALNISAGPNPWSSSEQTFPDGFFFYFQGAAKASLDEGADMKANQNLRHHGSRGMDGYWNGQDWVLQPEQQTEWSSDGYLAEGPGGRGGFSPDHLWWEMSIPKFTEFPHDQPIGHDGIRFCIAFVRGHEDHDERWEQSEDVWPGEGYSPRDAEDPRTWALTGEPLS